MKIDFPYQAKALQLQHNDHDKTYVNMFCEDLTLSLIPYNRIGEQRSDAKAYFEGSIDEIRLAKEVCKSIIWNDDYYDESEFIFEVIRTLGKSLSLQGSTVYELLYIKGKVVVKEFSTKNLFNCVFWMLQINMELSDKQRLNILNPKNIWRIQMPKEFAGAKRYTQMLTNLSLYNSYGPSFFLNDLETQTNSGFDFKKYQFEYHVYLKKLTKEFGWNIRNLDDKYRTDFYLFYSLLTFQWAQSILRNHIISEINTLFKRLEINTQVIIEGLPTSEEILQFREQLVLGEKRERSEFRVSLR